MNFAAFATAAAPSTHFVTTGAIPVTKIQQNATQNGTMQQVVGMGMDLGNGMQFVQGGGAMQNTPQLITLPIALPGAKPGDPQQTVQIQVLSPNLTLQQQQPKYQMQIPIQGFSQGGAVLTLAYSPENNDGLQLLGPEGMQVLMPQDIQMLPQQQQDNKDNILLPQQVYIQNQQIVINGSDDKLSTNNNNNNNFEHIIIKEEYDDTTNDDESSQGTEGTNDGMWTSSNPDIASYINKLPQQTALPVSLQQFLKLNPAEKKPETVSPDNERAVHSEAIFLQEDGSIKIKKKKKYKKKPAKPARPKPGQVILATSSDGTTIFCCPECQMAFQEKEQLESHLSTHKIERRFICGICGAGLKRKEHLERHKLGHNPERPFVCGVCRKGFKRREHLNLHAVIHSGIKSEVCNECGKGFYRKDHLRKHTRSHDAKRARDAAMAVPAESMSSVLKEATGIVDVKPAGADNNIIMPEITIHVPTSANVQVPVQINIPQHVVTSLAAQQANSNSEWTLIVLVNMNFAPFTGHIPTAAAIPSIHQFAAKFGYENGTGTGAVGQEARYQTATQTGGVQFAVAPAGATTVDGVKFRQAESVVVVSSAPPGSIALAGIAPIHTVNTGMKYQQISSSSVGLSNLPYTGQTTTYVQANDQMQHQTMKAEHRVTTVDKREYRDEIHHDIMATMMQQQVSQGTQLQQGAQQLLVVLHEPKEAAALARAIKQENRPERAAATAPAEFISIGDVGESAAWQSLGGGVADYLSALPLPLHHLLKYSTSTGDQKRDDTQHIVAPMNTLASLPNIATMSPNAVNGVVVQTATLMNQAVNTSHQVSAVIKKKKKKKSQKEKKPRPKPGEIRLTTALDGSTLYCCPECHMAYPERDLLEQHLVGHTMERRFICDICNAALKRKDHLTRHKQSHNPERPHVCSVCLKAFKRKEQLTLHFVIHSGEKRHVCNECGKGFYRKDHLRKHTRSHIARRVKAELSQQGSSAGALPPPVPAPAPS